MLRANFLLTVLVTLILTSCASEKLVLEEAKFSDLKHFSNADISQAQIALTKSCLILVKKNDERCERFLKQSAEPGFNFKKFIRDNHTVFRVHNSKDDSGLFTGYYIPVIKGSLKRTAKFRYPVYGMPRHSQYLQYTNGQIMNGALKGKAKELAYVDDDVALFFMQIQGSGKILLPNGKKLTVGYAGKNTQSYYAIGKYFIDNGIYTAQELSAEKIIKWLHAHPKQKRGIMALNRSYVFFRILNKEPLTSSGVEVTPNATLAVDKRFIKTHSILWLEGKQANSQLNNMFLAQDTGGAIKGIIRGDVFFGEGEEAFDKASHMKEDGYMYMLVPKN